jgi:hypothetical protein
MCILTNKDISDKYQNSEFYLLPPDFRGAFSYWVTYQNNNGTYTVDKPLEAFDKYILTFFNNTNIPEKFTYKELSKILSEKEFGKIPEILELNKTKPDFIDLMALSRNIFYMIIRNYIIEIF